MTKQKINKKKNVQTEVEVNQEYLVLGHLIKYNLYLLTKAVVFSAVSQNETNPFRAAEITNTIIQDLDLDTKRRTKTEADESSIQ